MISTDGSNIRKLASATFKSKGSVGLVSDPDARFLHSAVWDPTGRFIAYDDSKSLFVVDVKTGEEQQISLPQDIGEVTVTQWSPDGKQIGLGGWKSRYELWAVQNLLGDESERADVGR